MKLADLRKSIEQIGTGHDHKEVKVWLPGSRISLSGTLFFNGDLILVEGNVDPGSALDDVANGSPQKKRGR